MNPDCHFGDHRWGDNGRCRDCDAFNGGLLQWQSVEKARREGRHHGNHMHRTAGTAAACLRATHDEGPCADQGGCYDHEPSAAFMETLEPVG
jgi:hypothetical protein